MLKNIGTLIHAEARLSPIPELHGGKDALSLS